MRLLLVLALCSSCATTSGLINTGSRNVGTDVTPCEPINCGGGTADPIEVGVGVAVIVGIVLARALWGAD